MEKHFCDICNGLIDNPSNAIEMKIGRSYSPNPHVIIKEMCDDCANKLTIKVHEVINEIKESI